MQREWGKESKSYKMARSIRQDPAASYWLKDAVKTLTDRDIVDALQDAEVLLKYAKLRWDEVKQR